MKTLFILSFLIPFTFRNIFSQTLITTNRFSKEKIVIVINQDSLSKNEDTLKNNIKFIAKLKKCSFDGWRVLLFGVLGIGLNYTIRAAFQGMIVPNYRFAIEGAIVGTTIGFISSYVSMEKCKKQFEAENNKPESKGDYSASPPGKQERISLSGNKLPVKQNCRNDEQQKNHPQPCKKPVFPTGKLDRGRVPGKNVGRPVVRVLVD